MRKILRTKIKRIINVVTKRIICIRVRVSS